MEKEQIFLTHNDVAELTAFIERYNAYQSTDMTLVLSIIRELLSKLIKSKEIIVISA